MAADPDLIALFARGWAMTRDVPPPVARFGGHYIAVGQPDQTARYIFPTLDAQVIGGLGRTITEPFVYLKVCDTEAAVRAVLPPQWTIRQPPTYMMTAPLAGAAVDLPDGYKLAIEQQDAVLRATITLNGAPAARGRIALLGDTVLFDQIATDEAHRRRGLGRALMAALSNAALTHAAPNGLLSATEMGRALYEGIGWTVHAPYTSAVIPG